jgi:hypothetical protein
VRVILVENGASLNLNKLTILEGEGDGGEGGGIFNRGTLTVTNSTLTRNHAVLLGGGILNWGTLTVTNSTFHLNDVGFGPVAGVGIYNGGTMTVTNSTFSHNIPDVGDGFGGGIANDTESTLNMSNTILANSLVNDCFNAGTIATNVNNLIEDGSCSPDYSGDLLIFGFGDFGGPTQTMPLGADSPAIDKGDNTTCANAAVNNLDQRGFLRPIDGDAVPGAVCDIGAFEYAASASASILLIIDADSINNRIKSIKNISSKSPFCGDGSSSVCVNDDIAGPGVRELLFTRGNDITPHTGLVLTTGKNGDEGLFQFTNPDLQLSQQNGATFTIQEFIFAQGAAANANNLNKISGVGALTAPQILSWKAKLYVLLFMTATSAWIPLPVSHL